MCLNIQQKRGGSGMLKISELDPRNRYDWIKLWYFSINFGSCWQTVFLVWSLKLYGLLFASFFSLTKLVFVWGICLFCRKDWEFYITKYYESTMKQRPGNIAKATDSGRFSAKHSAQPFTHALSFVWVHVLLPSCSALGTMWPGDASSWPTLTFTQADKSWGANPGQFAAYHLSYLPQLGGLLWCSEPF